jgi:23S rRNA (adenine2503-C2)-methyltransferase
MQEIHKDLKSLALDQLENIVEGSGGKSFHTAYLYEYIHSRGGIYINDVTTLSKGLRAKLIESGWYISQLKTVEKFADPDGTLKYLFEDEDGGRFESVLLNDDNRLTLCISSQCGCRMGCKFCATARLEFRHNLTAGQIVDQVYRVNADVGRVDNVVFMGMGEPFDNTENVLAAADILNSPKGLNIGARHITISTCGIPGPIEALASHDKQYRLAVSIHAPDDQTRRKLMPVNSKYPLKDLLSAVRKYCRQTNRRVTFEYCLIDGVNDSSDNARQLVKLIEGIKCNVNLIEFNPFEGCSFKSSPRRKIQAFRDVLDLAGIEAHTRYKRGRSIKAACGQLGADWLDKQPL